MTKTFEEEAKEKILNSSHLYIAHEGPFADVDKGGGMALKIKGVVYVFPWLEFARNWHSDEEFQELFDKFSNLNDNYEKEVIRNSKLEDQNIGLKFQLQQQALPVVPECVAKDVKRLSLSTLADWNVAVSYISKETMEWLSTTGNINVFLGKSWTLCSLKINGFKVEKPQLFYLKHIDMSQRSRYFDFYLEHDVDESLKHQQVDKGKEPGTGFNKGFYTFTQQEIDSMQTGSYEQIPVPVEDGE